MEVSLANRNPQAGVEPLFCPADIDVKKCVVHLRGELQLALGYDYYIGSGDCLINGDWDSGSRWVCSQETKLHLAFGQSVSKNLKPGERIYANSGVNLIIDEAYVEKYILRATGKGADCTAGKQISGSVGCEFNPQGYDRVYDPYGEVYIGGKNVLEAGECYEVTDFSLRRQCDNTCDGCLADSECAQMYPESREYDGRIFGAVCSNNKLLMYGCESTGKKTCVEKDVLPDGTIKCVDEVDRKSCMLSKQITSGIECCTSDDCRGAGDYYCEWDGELSSKCVLEASCESDLDCGTAVKCDAKSKSIVEAKCVEGQCVEKTVSDNIECCNTRDCGEHQYCTSDNMCVDIPSSAPVTDAKSTVICPQIGYTPYIVIVILLTISVALAVMLSKKK